MLYDLSGQSNHLDWNSVSVNPVFPLFNGFVTLRTTPLVTYLRPIVSSSFNGMGLNCILQCDSYSVVAVFRVNDLVSNKVVLSFGTMGRAVSDVTTVRPIGIGFALHS
jgi:hypothetical protein